MAKKPDRKSVTGVKVKRGGQDDRDDYGSWAEAKKACRERVARETNVGQGAIKLDFDEDSGNTARFSGTPPSGAGTARRRRTAA